MKQLLEPRVEGILGVQLTLSFPGFEEIPHANECKKKNKKRVRPTDIDKEVDLMFTPNRARTRRQLSIQECAWNFLAYDPFDKD